MHVVEVFYDVSSIHQGPVKSTQIYQVFTVHEGGLKRCIHIICGEFVYI